MGILWNLFGQGDSNDYLEATYFMEVHSKEVARLPLAFAARAYDKKMDYHRLFYNDFLKRSTSVRNILAEKYGLKCCCKMPRDFFSMCEYLTQGLFFDRGVERESDMMLDCWQRTVRTHGDDVLSDDFEWLNELIETVLRGPEYWRTVDLKGTAFMVLDSEREVARLRPVRFVWNKLDVWHLDDATRCQIVCIMIYHLAMQSKRRMKCNLLQECATLEDLFLTSLYAVYLTSEYADVS